MAAFDGLTDRLHVATRNLMFIADNVDMTLSYGVSMPLLRDIKSWASDATCMITTDNARAT